MDNTKEKEHQPLDPTGISDNLHDLRKQGYTTSYWERLAEYHANQRLC